MRGHLLRPGQMRERFRFERLGAHTNGYISGDEEWGALYTCNAQKKTMRGSGDGEQEIAGALASINLVEIRTHYTNVLATLTARDRVIDQRTGETYNILHTDNPDGLKRMIVITAERGRANA